MTIGQVIRRFLIPAPIVTIYYLLKYGAKVSPKAEVELNDLLTIGKNTEIGSFTKIKTNGVLKIGKNVVIATGCCIVSHHKGLEIGDYSMIGNNTSIIGNNYRYDKLDVTIQEQGTISKHGIKIANNVWIGSGCSILDGADIGSGVIVASNSVVSSKIPENSIVMGNPAKVIFKRR
ncbi:acyltransferase [Okeania sp. SIO2B3]|uniref:acyltransferase n=1 Tax=Okeania sp. SIO2B3 TaxID=2607784 RepID=UPI0013C1C119|nr:acyltransferase [Okeania sp. SIO2B3]NET43251.1 acyltransferase [Okeania sp. SIO2B3]